MNDHRYDTYCGLYCGACEVIHAKTEKDKERVIDIWSKNVPGWNATPDQINCSGCKTDNVFVNCRTMCRIKPCARDKGVEFCINCDHFPCNFYAQNKSKFDQIPTLRHGGVMLKNQKYIKEHGVEKWLEEQKEKWKCPECDTDFAWYTDECKVCKKDLKGIKDYENLKDSDFSL